MVKILVTGHKGFIGSRLIDTLKNCDVVTDSINGKRINLLNIEEVMKIQPVDTVIHLGSKTKKEYATTGKNNAKLISIPF